MRVIVLDSHDLFRTGVSEYLHAQADMDIVAQTSTASRALRLISELRPDVVIVDIDTRDADGLHTARMIAEAQPDTPIVALTSNGGPPWIDAVKAGARCLIWRSDPVEHVAAATRAAAAGASWLSAAAAGELLAQIRNGGTNRSSRSRITPLSDRETAVLKMVAAGMDNAQIASALAISPNTVKRHVANLLRKLNVPNRLQAATYAVRHQLD